MKPVYKGGFIHCLACFIPREISSEAWDAMSLKDRNEQADWTAYRFRPEAIAIYCRSQYPGCTAIYLPNGSISVTGSVEQYDELFEKIAALKPQQVVL